MPPAYDEETGAGGKSGPFITWVTGALVIAMAISVAFSMFC